MQTKLFEVRDRGTFIPVMAVKFDPMALPTNEQEERERFLLKRAGFNGSTYVSLTELADGSMQTHYDPFPWRKGGTRTLFEAHRHIEKNWEFLESGAVIDVEFLLGERQTPKLSEAVA